MRLPPQATLTAGLVLFSSATQAFMMSRIDSWMAVIAGVICCRSSTTSGWEKGRDNGGGKGREGEGEGIEGWRGMERVALCPGLPHPVAAIMVMLGVDQA